MLFTEPPVCAVPTRLGLFRNFAAQEAADLTYSSQRETLRKLAARAPEKKPADPIPAPATPMIS